MGGKAFPDTKPIPADDLPYLYQFATNLVQNTVGFKQCTMLGSANRSREQYNDLDVAVKVEDADWVMIQASIKDFGFDTKKINEHCFSVAIPNESPFHYKGELAQVDFMQSRDIEYSINAYWSPTKSLYKGAHRNILLQAFLNILNTKEDIWDDITIRTKEYIDLYDGLVFLVQGMHDYDKNRRYKSIDRRVLKSSADHSFWQIVQTFLPEIQWYDLDSFETVYRVINNKYYVKDTANDMMQMIMREAGFIIQSAKLEMPHEIKCWVELV
jgi:hypothetical protein